MNVYITTKIIRQGTRQGISQTDDIFIVDWKTKLRQEHLPSESRTTIICMSVIFFKRFKYFVLAIYSKLLVLELETFSSELLKYISEFPDFKFCAVWTLLVMGTVVANITLDLKCERRYLIGVLSCICLIIWVVCSASIDRQLSPSYLKNYANDISLEINN